MKKSLNFSRSATVTVSCSKSPGHVFCNAYPWALRPTTERPSAPTYDMITASPFSTVLELDGISGTVVLDLEPLPPGRGDADLMIPVDSENVYIEVCFPSEKMRLFETGCRTWISWFTKSGEKFTCHQTCHLGELFLNTNAQFHWSKFVSWLDFASDSSPANVQHFIYIYIYLCL